MTSTSSPSLTPFTVVAGDTDLRVPRQPSARWPRRTAPTVVRTVRYPSVAQVHRRVAATVTRLIHDDVLSLPHGNAVLTALGMRRLAGRRLVTFRVPMSVTVTAQGPADAGREALSFIKDEVRRMRWTRFDGCPDGYAVDTTTPVHTDGHRGEQHIDVHAYLCLSVAVKAYQPGELITVARNLLLQDLSHADGIRHTGTDLAVWTDDSTSPPNDDGYHEHHALTYDGEFEDDDENDDDSYNDEDDDSYDEDEYDEDEYDDGGDALHLYRRA